VDENTTAQEQDGNEEIKTQEELSQAWLEESERRTSPDSAPVAKTGPGPAETPAEEQVELPAELREALTKVDSLKSLVDNLQHQVKSSDGRVQALQRELAISKSATQSVARAPNEQAVRAASASLDKWSKLKDEFPEWGSAVEELVEHAKNEAPAVDLSPLQLEIQNQINGIVQQFSRAVEEAKLFGAYKNYKQVVNSPEFVDWWKQQPGQIQQLTASVAAEDAIHALDLFSAHQQKVRDANRNVTQERSTRLAAAAVPARKTGAPPPKDQRELSAAEIWAAEAARREEARKART